FSVFAEHAAGDAPRGNGRYTLSQARASRYPIAEAASSCVFAGQAEPVLDAESDAGCIEGTAAPGVPLAEPSAQMWLAAIAVGRGRNVTVIYDRLAAAFRPVLEFDIMATSLLESDGMKRWLLVAEGRPVRDEARFEDFSFAPRLLAREPVMMRQCESELDLAYPADRTILEDGIRSFVAVPLIFADKV